jgi:hypothetical protein
MATMRPLLGVCTYLTHRWSRSLIVDILVTEKNIRNPRANNNNSNPFKIHSISILSEPCCVSQLPLISCLLPLPAKPPHGPQFG